MYRDPHDTALRLYDEAMEHLRARDLDAALEIGKNLETLGFSGAFEVMALAHHGRGELDRALEVLQEGVSVAPAVWVLWQLIGNVRSDRREFDEAREAYAQALECPRVDRGSVLVNQAISLVRARRFDEALEVCESVRSGRFAARAGVLALTVLNEIGRHDDVITRAGAVLELTKVLREVGEDPDLDHDVHAECARAYWDGAQDRERARESVTRALENGRFVRTAARVLVKITGRVSPDARRFRLRVRGTWPMPFDADEGPMGFFRNFVVVATTRESALEYARTFEPEGARGTLAIEECEDDGADADHPEGVYEASGHSLFSLNAN